MKIQLHHRIILQSLALSWLGKVRSRHKSQEVRLLKERKRRKHLILTAISFQLWSIQPFSDKPKVKLGLGTETSDSPECNDVCQLMLAAGNTVGKQNN